MKNKKMLIILFLVCLVQLANAEPIGTAFTYQGQLYDANYPANGSYDFSFKLYDADSDGNQVGIDVNLADVNVIDGYFTVELDFGSDAFDGEARWLEVGVRAGDMDDPNGYTTLSPRQEVTPGPYALYAKAVAGGDGGGSSMRDAIVRGFELTYSSTEDMYVEPGTLFHGNTSVNKINRTNLVLSLPSNWWDGTIDSYVGGEGWCYIGVNSSGDVKFLGDNPPNTADVEGNTEGTKLYWYDGSNYWRVIGAIRVDTLDQIERRWFQQGNTIMWDVPTTICTTISTSWTTPTTHPNTRIPAISTLGIFGICSYDPSSNTGIWIRPNDGTWISGSETFEGASAVRGGMGYNGGQRFCVTDDNQQIQYKTDTYDTEAAINVEGYVLNIR